MHVLSPCPNDMVPAGQLVQDVVPAAGEYLPRSHAMQVLLDTAPSTKENLPGVQAVQAVLPVDSAYVPAGQAMHEEMLVAPVLG